MLLKVAFYFGTTSSLQRCVSSALQCPWPGRTVDWRGYPLSGLHSTLPKKIELDDWPRAVAELPDIAKGELDKIGETVASVFLKKPVDPYQPIIVEYS